MLASAPLPDIPRKVAMSGYRKIPDFVREQIAACASDRFYVGRTKSFSLSELKEGALAHLGIVVTDGAILCEQSILPEPENDRWSRWNVEGRWVRRTDLPKTSKSWGWDSPNFGDWGKGSHHVSFTREVYQRQLRFGHQLSLLLDRKSSDNQTVVIGVRVDRVFDRTLDLHEDDLLMACSLLRENFGSISILPTDLTATDWLANQRVIWEILPVGEGQTRTFDDVVRRLHQDPSAPRLKNMQQRYDNVFGMNPAAIVVGSGEFTRYFGFKFRDDLVALENLDYGNALYLMYENWSALSQRSRLDLLTDTDANFDRIVHRVGWEIRLRNLLTTIFHEVACLVTVCG
jgi:hypothetical protein